jgi:hypothetical protein
MRVISVPVIETRWRRYCLDERSWAMVSRDRDEDDNDVVVMSQRELPDGRPYNWIQYVPESLDIKFNTLLSRLTVDSMFFASYLH